jgi:alanine racemase
VREVSVDLDVLLANYARLRGLAAPAKVMAVVKADAYGHSALKVAAALDAAGVDALGVADIEEALSLRFFGVRAPVMCWLLEPELIAEALENNIELGVSTLTQLDQIAAAAQGLGLSATIHLKIDTGLGRNGFAATDWPKALQLALTHQTAGLLRIVGVFSHLSNTDRESDLAQQQNFERAIKVARELGVKFEMRHLAASAATLSYPEMHYDMVRVGIALYGLNPSETGSLAERGLRPVMRASARVANLKRVGPGQGVSYGYRYVTSRETTLALVPFGYADGMPRIAESPEVLIAGKRYRVSGRVAMDQFVVDVGDDDVSLGDECVIFGDPASGEPSADDIAASAGTINYELVTRVGARPIRRFIGGPSGDQEQAQ